MYCNYALALLLARTESIPTTWRKDRKQTPRQGNGTKRKQLPEWEGKLSVSKLPSSLTNSLVRHGFISMFHKTHLTDSVQKD